MRRAWYGTIVGWAEPCGRGTAPVVKQPCATYVSRPAVEQGDVDVPAPAGAPRPGLPLAGDGGVHQARVAGRVSTGVSGETVQDGRTDEMAYAAGVPGGGPRTAVGPVGQPPMPESCAAATIAVASSGSRCPASTDLCAAVRTLPT
ncbi:hypothetical protein GCM10010365_56270 [Streptomyces poonensis]|uniref:Uncharacterized protein n=1 Tax=Streptomyces poonensis TaxID=68255 RepID=A0A918PZN1_9ACTN|nr:hypothetical protein GCM10010365_56270 [Streptomyces poonensis]GLJ93868.1 hypothetical protein GCM10017589_64850 [Streptomyces poonensis]